MKGPDLLACGGNWSPLVAAGPQSALSGVLAGFVFTAMTVVLSTGPSRDQIDPRVSRQRSYALQLFAASFIIFALDSYFTSISAGEQACNRAYAENALSGGILGVGATLMIAGIGWLIAAYAKPENAIADLISYIAAGIWAVIVIMLSVSGVGIGEAMLTGRSHGFVNTWPWVLGAVVADVVGLFVWLFHDLGDDSVITFWVRFATVASLGAAITCELLAGIVSAISGQWWFKPPSVAIYIVLVLSMIIPAVPLIASVPSVLAARNAAREPTIEQGEENGGRTPENSTQPNPRLPIGRTLPWRKRRVRENSDQTARG